MSVNEYSGRVISGIADSALTKYTAVRISSTSGTLHFDVATDGRAIGIVCDSFDSGAQCSIAIDHIGFVKVDGSGTPITTSTGLKATTGGVLVAATSGDYCIARPLEESTASGDIKRAIIGYFKL